MNAQQEKEQHLKRIAAATKKISSPTFMNNMFGQIVHANEPFLKVFGWSENELYGVCAKHVLLPQLGQEVAGFLLDKFTPLLYSTEQASHEIVLADRHDNCFWFTALSAPVYSSSGELLYNTTSLKEVTQTKVREALEKSVLPFIAQDKSIEDILSQLCSTVQNIVPNAIACAFAFDDACKLLCLAAPNLSESDKAKIHASGITFSHLSKSSDSDPFHPNHAFAGSVFFENCQSIFAQLNLNGCTRFCPIYGIQNEIIGLFSLSQQGEKVAPPTSKLHQILMRESAALCTLALSRENNQKQIHKLAFHDSLTGLPNRNLLLIKAKQLLQQSHYGKSPVAVLLLVLKASDQMTDSEWASMKQTVLMTVVERLQNELRSKDTLAHFPNDELVLMLAQTNESQALAFANRLYPIVSSPIEHDGASIHFSVEIGIASAPLHGKSIDELYQYAHVAMCKADENFDHEKCIDCPAFIGADCPTTQLEIALQKSIRLRQLQLHYQPQINLTTGQLHGVEALARWFHPQLGAIPPAHFIPLAEACGFITQIGLWAIEQACQQMQQWQQIGLLIPNVSVNLSSACFQNKNLPRYLNKTLDKHNIAPQCLTLELTENLLLHMTPSTMEIMNSIQSQGIKLSIDDFGIVYSGLNYLRRIAFSELKLDRSFTASLGTDDTTHVLSKAVRDLGASLGISVIAEGIETHDQKQILMGQGYEIGQGYLFAKPLSAAELTQNMQSGGQWLQTSI